jgi:hypothetical protein
MKKGSRSGGLSRQPVTSYHSRQPSSGHFLNLGPAERCGSCSFLCLFIGADRSDRQPFPECENCSASQSITGEGLRELLGKAPEVLELCEARGEIAGRSTQSQTSRHSWILACKWVKFPNFVKDCWMQMGWSPDMRQAVKALVTIH